MTKLLSKMKYLFLLICSILLISCSEEHSKTVKTKKPKIDEKEFLDHEILNDSITYRIKEYDKKNTVLRNICVFKNDEVIKEKLIYKIQKNYLHDEGYNTANSIMYEVIDKNKIQVFDITTHYFDYKVESIDTVATKVIVTSEGEIVSENYQSL